MALTKDVNSYVTVSEADAYFADRINASAWTDANNAVKSQALITATQLLDELSWVGTAISDAQQLAWPRVGSYFDNKIGVELYLDGTTIPKNILTATMEEAYHLITNSSILDETGASSAVSISGISLTSIVLPSIISGNVKRLIRPLRENGNSRVWFRSN
jgi:hypothetical protein